MKPSLRIESARQRREFAEADFPLAVGMTDDGALQFGEAGETAAIAWLGHDGGQVFLQPVAGSETVWLNGTRLDKSAWLTAGDTIKAARASVAITVDAGVLVLASVNSSNPDRNKAIAASPTGKAEDLGAPSGQGEFSVAPIGPIRGQSSGSIGRNILIALFVLLLAGVTFVVIASPVRLAVSPNPDSLQMDGLVPPIPFAGRYLVMPGSYLVTAEKKGYRKLAQGVTIDFGSEPVFEFELRKLPGLLDVVSLPIANARVEIDDQAVGRTPLESFEIEAGRHDLRLTADRYLPAESNIEILGMGTRQTAEITLQPGWGTLVLASEPGDAAVWLNGEEIGKTPLQAELPDGKHSLELRRPGWKPFALDVTVTAGEALELPPVRLEKVDAIIELTTSPPGAIVALNNEFLGQSPMTLTLGPDRDHKLTVSKVGFAAATRTVRLDDGQSKSLNIVLKPQYGIVFVSTRPAGAELRVDGKLLGPASQRLRLTTAPHRIEVAKAGYSTYSMTVTPVLGESKRVDVRLEKIAELSQSSVAAGAPATASAAASALRSIPVDKPVRFEMGASRREAGRRSNETLHSVEITRSFYIGAREVTNEEYRRFDPQHNSGTNRGVDLDAPDLPVVSVSWDDAARYMNWLSQKEGLPPVYAEMNGRMVAEGPISNGYRLPTEAEWVYAARYEGGQLPQDQPLKYPWGVGLPPPSNSGNYADETAAGQLPLIISNYSDGSLFAAPVGRFPPNRADIYDLGGNVAEWCHDYYGIKTDDGSPTASDPTGPETGGAHVVRGSSWRHGSITELRFSYRDYARKPRNDLGFRVARYVAAAPK